MNAKTENQTDREDRENIRPALRILQGAGLATALLTIAFLTMGESNTEDLRWMILPYIFMLTAGGLGGLIFHLMQPVRNRGGVYKVPSIMLSVLIYTFLLAVGFVIGMNGPN